MAKWTAFPHADKAYAEAYRTLWARLRPPESLIERLYTSQMARHFYPELERERRSKGGASER
jgi:hypothetical protein